MKKIGRRRVIITVLSLSLLGLVGFVGPNERYFEIAKNLDIFATLYKEVNTYYVDEVNPNSLIKNGIDAMLSKLDPYTNYIPEDDIEDYRTMTTGQYGGIGALIGKRNGKNTVIMPYIGFPAHKVGLQIGDELTAVDGVNVENMSTSEISKLLKGQANTTLTLTLKRFGQEEAHEVQLTRERITIDNVPYYGMASPEVGYIRLSDFTTNAGKEVKDALLELKDKGATRVILDLRDNPGGLLNEAVNVSNVFIPKGAEVVSTKGKVTDWNKTYSALNIAVDTEIPVAVLTSSKSASAAEIVAGVIQDYDRGVLVGQKTFGKGLVQATRPLTYNSQLKITTAKYYIPSGRCIQAIDYSHRNEDGSVGKIPDSLKVAFKTSNDRVVYDGGGVDPDISVENPDLMPIVLNLVAKGMIFDYATYYHHKTSEIASAKDFKLSDQDYYDFVTWLGDKEFDYTTRVERSIEDLEEISKRDKYYDDIKDQIASLQLKVKHNKDQDLMKFRDDIVSILEEEIASRYYFQQGIIEASFDNDLVIQTAVEVLNDRQKYDHLLSRQQ